MSLSSPFRAGQIKGFVDDYIGWYLIIGALLLLVAAVGTRVARSPLTPAMLYLAIGLTLAEVGWLRVDFLRHARLLEIASEIAVILSLFSTGLRMRFAITDVTWRLPVALALISMMLTVALIAGVAMLLFHLPLGAAVILGAVLAPTDPVLAADVKVEDCSDTDPVRIALTGEAGLNDGTAFPFLMLGLGLLHLHELGDYFERWLLIDGLWKLAAGFVVGLAMGWGTGKGFLFLRRVRKESIGFDDFLALGVIAATYGVAHFLNAWGFIAVFVAGWALRSVERRESGGYRPSVAAKVVGADKLAAHPDHAPAYMAEAMLRFNDQMDRVGELALVLLVGALLATIPWRADAAVFAAILFLVLRPLAVMPLCFAAGFRLLPAALVSWFGIRGIGSVYYLAYAITHGLPESLAEVLVSVTLVVIALSTLVHGATSAPFMRRYARRTLNP